MCIYFLEVFAFHGEKLNCDKTSDIKNNFLRIFLVTFWLRVTIMHSADQGIIRYIVVGRISKTFFKRGQFQVV